MTISRARPSVVADVYGCFGLFPQVNQKFAERCIWGSDWPHVGSLGKPMPDDADLLALLLRYLPDAQAVENVLVKNPARLFGF